MTNIHLILMLFTVVLALVCALMPAVDVFAQPDYTDNP